MAFVFPLESVLRLRVNHERQEQARLELMAQKLQQAAARCESLKKEKVELEKRMLADLQAGMTSADLYLRRAAKAGLERVEAEAAHALEEVRNQWEAQRQKFLEARRDREVMSSARRRHYEAYRLEQARREQQQIDDLFAMRRLRQ